MTEAKPFITLLKRSIKSKFQTILMNNQLLSQCYDLNVDSDVGLHYILPIPDTEVYADEFYNTTMLLHTPTIISAYNGAHRAADDFRKEAKLKPKDLVEEVCLRDTNLVFTFQVSDKYVETITVPVIIPDDTDPVVMNIMKHFTLLVERIKPGGFCIDVDGSYLGLQERVSGTSEIFFYTLKHAGKKVRVPLYRSLFLGIKELDEFHFNVQETDLSEDIFVSTFKMSKAGIEEIFWGYIVNY